MEEEKSIGNDQLLEDTPSKKKYKSLVKAGIFVFAFLILIISITSSTSYKVYRLKSLTKHVRKEYTNYSTSDLEKAEAKFEKYVKRLDKCELSGKQEEKVRNMKVECRKNFVKAKAYIIKKEFQNTIEDAGSEVKEFFQSLSDED